LYVAEASAQHVVSPEDLLSGLLSVLEGQQSSLDNQPARSIRQSDEAGNHVARSTKPTIILSNFTRPKINAV
jgi:hypothetical protein